MMKYRIVREPNLDSLSKEVDSYIALGWKPQGSITIDFDSFNQQFIGGKYQLCNKTYIQVMVRGD